MVMELGYQSTECRGPAWCSSPKTGAGLPPLDHHYFEFVEQEALGQAAIPSSSGWVSSNVTSGIT